MKSLNCEEYNWQWFQTGNVASIWLTTRKVDYQAVTLSNLVPKMGVEVQQNMH